MIKNILKYLVKGVIYSAAFTVIGGLFSFLKGWELLKGAYIFVLGGGVFSMIVSAIMLFGTPSTRKAYLEKKNEDRPKDPIRGGEGIGPALMAIEIIVIGFMLEALMH